MSTWVTAPTSLPFYDNQAKPSRQARLSESERRLLRERSENGAKHEVPPRSGEARKEYRLPDSSVVNKGQQLLTDTLQYDRNRTMGS